MESNILIEIFNAEQEFTFELTPEIFEVEIGLAQVTDDSQEIKWEDIIGRPAYDSDFGCWVVN
jgi:hypothetical protein